MRDSPGKTAARQLFYRVILPDLLPRAQLQAGNHLVLLGDAPREMEHIDALRIARANIYSVERNRSIFLRQQQWHLGVSLFCGEMEEYLLHLLHTNHAFAVLNLDVEGSYRTQLDPAMASVLLFCWRNPETVVATYSSIGRDTETLWEGIAALALLLWCVPDDTMGFVRDFSERYERFGFENGLRMVLRDLQWLRSNCLHACRASALLGETGQAHIDRLLHCERVLWSEATRHKPVPLAVQDLLDIVQSARAHIPVAAGSPLLPTLGIDVAQMRNIVYRAQLPWSQRCYITKMRSLVRPIGIQRWLGNALERFRTAPLHAIARDGACNELTTATVPPEMGGMHSRVLWATGEVYSRFHPSQPSGPHELAVLARTITLIKRQRAFERQQELLPMKEEEAIMKKVLVRSRKLTEDGIARVRELAARGYTTDEVLEEIPGAPRMSVRAHIAVARRTNDGQQFMRDGELTEYGRAELRRLARHARCVSDLAGKVPASVPRATLRAFFAGAQRKRNGK